VNLNDGACLFQDILVPADEFVKLECLAGSDGQGFASMALTLQDINHDSIVANQVVVGAGTLQSHSTILRGTADVSRAVATIYAESLTGFDDCVISIGLDF